MNPQRAMGAAQFRIDRANPARQDGIRPSMSRGRATVPRVVPEG